MTGELVYVYAVRAGGRRAPDTPGVDGEHPRVLVEGELAAVVGTVAAERFAEEPLQRMVSDLAGLDRLARAHHAVVVAAGVGRAIAPLRLATVYRSDAAVRAFLRDRREQLDAVLQRVAGCREWGVKAGVPAGGAEPEPAAADPERPGTAYLTRRRAVRDGSQRRRATAEKRAAALHELLCGLAADACTFPLREALVLNASYLVPSADEAGFLAAAGGTRRGMEVEVTGPWPPFSFAGLDTP